MHCITIETQIAIELTNNKPIFGVNFVNFGASSKS